MPLRILAKTTAHQKLCEDKALADRYNFDGAQFIKSMNGHKYDDGEFDLQSIMLYPSTAYASQQCE